VLEKQKQMAQVSGKTSGALPFAGAGTSFEGYEIHAGRTRVTAPLGRPLVVTRRLGKKTHEHEGAISDNGLIFGCYIHGLFDNDRLRRQLLGWLCRRKGIVPAITSTTNASGREFDRLAALLEKHLDMKRVNRLVSVLTHQEPLLETRTSRRRLSAKHAKKRQ